MSKLERIKAVVDKCVRGKDQHSTDALVQIISAACDLEKELYRGHCVNGCGGRKLFLLRKALESVFGHELPDDEDYEEPA